MFLQFFVISIFCAFFLFKHLLKFAHCIVESLQFIDDPGESAVQVRLNAELPGTVQLPAAPFDQRLNAHNELRGVLVLYDVFADVDISASVSSASLRKGIMYTTMGLPGTPLAVNV